MSKYHSCQWIFFWQLWTFYKGRNLQKIKCVLPCQDGPKTYMTSWILQFPNINHKYWAKILVINIVTNINEKYEASMLIRNIVPWDILCPDINEKYWAQIYQKEILSHLNHAGFGIEPWEPVHWSERRVERVFLLLWKIFLLLLWKIFLLLWKIFLLDSLPTYTFGSSRLGVSVVHIQIQGYLLRQVLS